MKTAGILFVFFVGIMMGNVQGESIKKSSVFSTDICTETSNSCNTGFTLWQLPSQKGPQMMSYVMQSEGGKVVVIDGGWEKDGIYLKGFLASLGNHVDAWFITHSHSDHISALTSILKSPGNLKIENIYGSFPPLEWIRQYDLNATRSFQDFSNALSSAGKNYTDVDVGDLFDLGEIHIEILAVGDTNITENAANNFSMVMKISDTSKSILFTGDLGQEAGDKLLSCIDHQKLKADYVQMSHHGNTGVDFLFYETVQPDYCLWPTPLWLWNNDNGGGYDSGPWTTLETQQWMKKLNVKKNYVSGIDGLVEIK